MQNLHIFIFYSVFLRNTAHYVQFDRIFFEKAQIVVQYFSNLGLIFIHQVCILSTIKNAPRQRADQMEEKKMKKLLAILLCLCMVLSLAACAGKSTATAETPAATETPAADEAPAAEEAAPTEENKTEE